MLIKRTPNQIQIGRLIIQASRALYPDVGVELLIRWETDEDRARAARWEAQREELRRRSETAEAF